MLIRTKTTSLLQIMCELMPNYKALFKCYTNLDNTGQSIIRHGLMLTVAISQFT